MSTAEQEPLKTEPTPPPTPPAEAEKAIQSTEYLILSKDKTGYWTEQTTVKSRGSEAAIRDWIKGATEVDGTYVAVPKRSWNPVTVKTETQTKIMLT